MEANALIYQTEQIREFERQAQERYNLSGALLMQRAGTATINYLLKRWPHAKSISVFCGTGNNGGDGYVVAKLAYEKGLKVSVWQVGPHQQLKGEAQEAFLNTQKAGIVIKPFNANEDFPACDVIVDAICGIGLHENLREEILPLLKKIEESKTAVLAIDIPTGINADTGQILGAAIRATATITFIGLKLGLLTGNGASYTGDLTCHDLDLPKELFSIIKPCAQKITLNHYLNYLKPRPRNWHKGLSGHVLIIGGDVGYTGAPRMAAEAAFRVGAGLVSVATHPDIANTMNANLPELMCHGIETVAALTKLMDKATVVVVGPGLGQSDWAKTMWNAISNWEIPKIVDADALNLLAKTNQVRQDWILTPHPGEAARLLNTSSDHIQQDRLAAAIAIQKRYGGVGILKGAGSLVIAPDALPLLCDRGNPGMATAGMGDVLSGVLGGLVAQKIPLEKAAPLGVCLHAMAGDYAAQQGERGLVATDLMPYLRQLVNIVKNGGRTTGPKDKL